VAFVDIDVQAGETLCAEVEREGNSAVFTYADVCDIAGLKLAISQLAEQLPHVDVLINNAANDTRIDFNQINEEYWDNSQAVNLRHHVFASQQVAQLMKPHHQGSIINFGSVSWRRGRNGFIGYSTAKAAIHGFTRCLARELGRDGIRVNSLMPGAVLTPKQAKLWRTPQETAQFHQLQALAIDVLPEDIAAMALFLAADDSRAITGQNFVVDAGLT
jgi:NAD(P)-dependent dehydrogenase (short-subunit alcohol dehydrogenase family)